jgi:hypothetical protein
VNCVSPNINTDIDNMEEQELLDQIQQLAGIIHFHPKLTPKAQ